MIVVAPLPKGARKFVSPCQARRVALEPLKQLRDGTLAWKRGKRQVQMIWHEAIGIDAPFAVICSVQDCLRGGACKGEVQEWCSEMAGAGRDKVYVIGIGVVESGKP